jgi:hypothetical protein
MTKTEQKKQTTGRKNKAWLRSPDQRKRPKLFNVTMMQLPDGSFHLLGGGSRVEVKANQYKSNIYNIDVRDLATEMRMNGVTSF